jgi:hypothetical protein
MQLFAHRNHIDAVIPADIKDFIHHRYEHLVEDSSGEVIPVIILVNPDYAFTGSNGLLTVCDAYEEHSPREAGFVRPYEWVSHWPDLGVYELLYLQDPDNGLWIIVPESVVEGNPDDLKWVLTDESQGGLSESQPL